LNEVKDKELEDTELVEAALFKMRNITVPLDPNAAPLPATASHR
jgi:hypothetical protein